jgi:hypothetical protein
MTSSLSLSLGYHDNLLSLGAATPPHGRESIMDLEPAVVPWSIDPIYDFSFRKQFLEILGNAKIIGKLLDFFNKSKNISYLF